MNNEILSIISQHYVDDKIKNAGIRKELFNRYGIEADDSQIRITVNELRVAKHPIGSDREGYFLARFEHELDHTKAQMTSRVGNIMRAVTGLEKSFQSEEPRLAL